MNNIKLLYPYILFLAVSLLSSCTSDTPNPNFGKSEEVSFDVSDKTRASAATDLTEFAVFGDMKLPGNASAAPTVIFNNTKVEYTNDKWSYSGVQYWFPQHEHSFIAVSPSSVFSTDNPPQYLNSKLSFSYTILNTGDVADIVVATHRRLYNTDDPNSTSTIIFRFGHIMSLINLAPALDDNSLSRDGYIKIHKLEFSGVKIKARFDIQPASILSSNQTDDMSLNMTEEEYGNFTIGFTTPVKVGNDAQNVSLFTDTDAIIMIPQDFATDSKAEIIVHYTINEDTSMQQVSLPLQNLKWDSAIRYLYKFTIEKNGVKLDNCEIYPWNEVQGEEITVD